MRLGTPLLPAAVTGCVKVRVGDPGRTGVGRSGGSALGRGGHVAASQSVSRASAGRVRAHGDGAGAGAGAGAATSISRRATANSTSRCCGSGCMPVPWTQQEQQRQPSSRALAAVHRDCKVSYSLGRCCKDSHNYHCFIQFSPKTTSHPLLCLHQSLRLIRKSETTVTRK